MLGSVVLDPDSAIPPAAICQHTACQLGFAGEEIMGTMTFAPSIWALEIDGKPTLAFEAMRSGRSPDRSSNETFLSNKTFAFRF
jgi:hypothetical protein